MWIVETADCVCNFLLERTIEMRKNKRENSWSKSFGSILIIAVIIIIVIPLLLYFNPFKSFIKIWTIPIKNHLDGYLTLIGAIIGSVLTISGAMFQYERTTIKNEKQIEKNNLNIILSEMQYNSNIINIIHGYFKANNLKEVYYDSNLSKENWVYIDNRHSKNVNVTKSILLEKPVTEKKDLVYNLKYYNNITKLKKLYDFFDVIKISDVALSLDTVNDTYSLFFELNEDLKEYLEDKN